MSAARRSAPLETLFESKRGPVVALPPALARLYGTLRLEPASVFSNFVTTLDGVVALQVKGHETGADISGFNVHDRIVMGLLRAVADAVVVGAGLLAADPRHVWTPAGICPEFANDYGRLRRALGKSAAPLNVVVSASGRLDLRLPVFSSRQAPALIVTTAVGAKRLAGHKVPGGLAIRAVRGGAGAVPARTILEQTARHAGGRRILVEGGPHLLGCFCRERLIDEQFLTLAPQVAGRGDADARLGLVMGETFAPRNPLWGALTDVRRSASHLFLRYSFPGATPRTAAPRRRASAARRPARR